MSIHIIGDLMLDEWISGDVNRISPEAPVPVVSKSKVVRNVGGSGNLAVNLSNIGNKVKLYSFLGFDENGDSVNDLLEEHKNIDTINVIVDDSVQTTTKTRITDSTGKHIVRVDVDNKTDYSLNLWDFVVDSEEGDVICISDYNKGVIEERQTIKAIDYLKSRCKVLVDPKNKPDYYKGAFLVKPNMKEYKEWFGEFSIEKTFQKLDQYQWKWLVVTDGPRGLHVFRRDDFLHNHFACLTNGDVFDVTGAGDSVMAIIANGIDKGENIFEVCEKACICASQLVQKRGVTTLTKELFNI